MIEVKSRDWIQRFVEAHFGYHDLTMISINGSSEPYPPFDLSSAATQSKFDGCLVEVFDDILPDSSFPGSQLISEKQAFEIVQFAYKHVEKILNPDKSVYVHCTGGVSRSSAVAAAILYVCNGDDWQIFNNGTFCPNEYVYKSILKAAGIKINESLLQAKFDKNVELWKLECRNRGWDFHV